VAPGGNPHRWYSPPDVHHVARAIANAYARLDPRRTAAFRRLETRFETRALERYTQTLARIRRAYGGAPVGASESVFEPLAQALGLRLLTPRSFLNAISEGTEPTAADRSAIERQIAGRRIRLWVYNRQNTTPDVDRITQAARARGIPVASITETLVPQSASFQSWQVRQLESIARALGSGGAR
jgi:zinc/manganese transport system substrate-binding protein